MTTRSPFASRRSSVAKEEGRYLFDHGQHDEISRLKAIEAVCDPWSVDLLERAGTRRGWRCLDVGAGAGSVARWMAERVGPQGQVVAVDLDTSFLDPLGSETLRVERHDLVEGPLEPGAFDLVHARFLLEWLPDWELALDHLVASARPGGAVVISDMAWGSRIPGAGVLETWTSAVPAVLREVSGYSPDCGPVVPDALRARGVRIEHAEARAAMVEGGSRGAEWLRLSVEAMRGPMLRMGLLDEGSLQAAAQLLADRSAWLWLPPMVSVFGIRSSDSSYGVR